MERISREIEMVRARYGEVTVSPELNWIIVEHYPLPEGRYNRAETRLLHFINPGYPQVLPDNFLVPAGLRTVDGAPLGDGYKEPQNHFDETWGVFSWHAKKWQPAPEILDGDNLLTFFITVDQRLRGEK